MHIPTHFSGDIIQPGDSNYDQASTVLARKGTPALVLRPKSAADVAAAIHCGVENKLTISVRSGGHSNAGLSTNDGGLVVDVRHLNTIEVINESERLVRVGAGATWAEVAEALKPHGWAISSGDTKSVGVSGLTLGAGIGWMVRKYGLALDNLQAAEIVTADGRTLRVSKDEHTDLFWAIRGGGGNFGIVTSLEFAAEPIAEVYAGKIVYSLDNLAVLLKGWRDIMRQASDELTATFFVMPGFGGTPKVAIIMCAYASDDHEVAMQAIDPLLHLDTVQHQDIAKKPYADVLEDAMPPQGVKIIVNNMFVQDFSNELIDTICAHKDQILQIRSVGGAMNRVPADATAFAHRDSEALIVCPVFASPKATMQEIEVALKPWHDIAAFGKGAYINFFSEVTQKEVEAAYPPATYERLARIKATYDPHNIFNQNLNIEPANE